MQDLTIEQLKFARSIGAVYIDNSVEWGSTTREFYRKPGFAFKCGEWESGWAGERSLESVSYIEKIDFTPLEEPCERNQEQLLEWPIGEELIGREVRFDGYGSGSHTHWGFKVGDTYIICRDADGDIGPIATSGAAPSSNYNNDFKFTLLPEGYKPVSEQPETAQKSSVSDGSTASYYELPNGSSELQDLISHRNMNAQDGEIFRAIYRKGLASHSDELRDAKKVQFYAKAEVARLEALKS